jgi:hypothetical protein
MKSDNNVEDRVEDVLCTSMLEHSVLYLAQRLRKALNLTNFIACKAYLAFNPWIISQFEFLDRVAHKLNQEIPLASVVVAPISNSRLSNFCRTCLSFSNTPASILVS